MRSRASSSAPSRAIVLGAGMAGLAAARALAAHVAHVTVVERDHLPAGPAQRPGVPQARHLHALLPGGERALEQLFPSFADGLLAAGAQRLDVPGDVAWLNPMGWMPRFARHQMLSASRDLIEWYTRSRLGDVPNVEILDGVKIVGLTPTADGRGVGGVRLGRLGTYDETSVLRADLVVDATGRRSQAADWLEQLGYGRPEETRIDAGVAYASRTYRRFRRRRARRRRRTRHLRPAQRRRGDPNGCDVPDRGQPLDRDLAGRRRRSAADRRQRVRRVRQVAAQPDPPRRHPLRRTADAGRRPSPTRRTGGATSSGRAAGRRGSSSSATGRARSTPGTAKA